MSSTESILPILQKTTVFFEQKGVESARLNAELLIAHVLGLGRMDLYLQFDRPLTIPELGRLRDAVRRRAGREPLQYITGRAQFRTLELRVGPGVLIPRPETELLVGLALERLDAMDTGHVLDFGTGSGCVALCLASESDLATVVGMDASEEALAYARGNQETLGVDDSRVEWVHGTELSCASGGFDAIISNPPYIPSSQIDGLQPEVRFEPREALDGGSDGMDCYRMMAQKASNVLKEDGWILLEIGCDQAEAVQSFFRDSGKWQELGVHPDLSGRPRILSATRARG